MKNCFLSLFIAFLFVSNSPLSAQETHFKTRTELEKEEMEKLKILGHSAAFSLHYGHFELFPFSKASDNTTNIGISNYHKMLTLQLSIILMKK